MALVVEVERANIQRQVTLTCSIRIVRDDMVNINLNQVGINTPNLESDLEEAFRDSITAILTAEHNNNLEHAFIMRLHSNINVVVHRRAPPDINVFDVAANFTVKYNNEDFWDYGDRFEDGEVQALGEALFHIADILQVVNGVEFFRVIEDLDIRIGGEQPIVIPHMGGGRGGRRRSSRSRRRSSRSRRRSSRSRRRSSRRSSRRRSHKN